MLLAELQREAPACASSFLMQAHAAAVFHHFSFLERMSEGFFSKLSHKKSSVSEHKDGHLQLPRHTQKDELC